MEELQPAHTKDEKDILPQSIEEIYERHYGMIYRISFSYLKNVEDTKDAVSEIFLILLQKKVKFQNFEHEKAWLIRVTINLCKNRLKHWWRKNRNISDYPNLESKNPLNESSIINIVMELPERFRDVIYLYYYEGYTSEEISKILKKPHSTIRYHLQEARKYLKGVLDDEK